jgi:ubiquinone/menaquinone biosynthesis C-methylase UbiE
MSALPPDYDNDPERSRSFRLGWQEDVHAPVAERVALGLARTVVDVGCGIGRFAAAVTGRVQWIGLDSSPRQLRDCPHRPVAQADAVALPIGTEIVDAVTMLWMLYHLEEPRAALAEAKRILRPGGLVAVCTSSRSNDPELVPDGYARTSFDAEEAPEIVADVFGASNVEVHRWDTPFVELRDRAEVSAYARSHLIPSGVAERVQPPITLTKRGCLVWATKS